MATVTKSSLNVSGAVSVNAGNAVSYTVPANSYAVISCVSTQGGSTTIKINGFNTEFVVSTSVSFLGALHLGPGITITAGAGGGNTQIYGVVFINT